MAEELQQLLEKIKAEGVDKANAEAAEIVAKAKADAAAIIKGAEEKAAAEKAAAKSEAEAYAKRAEATISQAARDTVLAVNADVTKLLESLLAKNVDDALADPAKAASLALEAVKALGGQAEVAASKALAESLRAQLAAAAVNGVTVVTDDTMRTGFSVRLSGGRVEHDFSGAAIQAALAKRLRPELARLMK